MMRYLPNKKAFTLFEVTLVIAIFSIIVVYVFSALLNLSILRASIMSRVELEEDLYFFVEQLATTIKEGGSIDYEEYWNRQVVGTGKTMGHYTQFTGFGNYGKDGVFNTATFGNGLYYCASIDISNRLGIEGCLTALGFYNTTTSAGNQWGEPQRYGEYREQFTDYNSPTDGETSDGGDENNDGSARGDNDDRNLGDGPALDASFVKTSELYLFEGMTNERTYLRWVVRQDPNAPTGATCDSNGEGSGCIGNIQMLRLVGKDIGANHDENAPGAFDGIVDTWVCHPNWENVCHLSIDSDKYKIPANLDDGWVNIFPDGVDVRDVQFFIEPMKTLRLAYAMDPNEIVHPYVRLSIRIGYGWSKRSVLHNIDPEISVTTTVSLTSYIVSLNDAQ